MSLKILILGANGFIGSSLIEAILKQTSWEIYGIDLASNKLGSSLKNEKLHFTLGDINTNAEWVDSHIKSCDVVLPLVAIANPAIYVKDPLRIFELDFESNLRIVRQCVVHKKRIIFPSTSEVYGMSEDSEFDEDKSPLTQGPINKERWIYSCCKQLMDRVIYAYGVRGQLQFTLFRPFNWIGPLQDDPRDLNSNNSRVVTSFLKSILYGQDMKLADGGEQRRCFTDINDGISALLKIIENRNGCADSKIFNIGNPRNDYSIKELAEKMLNLASGYVNFKDIAERVKIVSIKSADYYGSGYQDLKHRVPAIVNAKKYLDWQPEVSLDAALKNIFDCYLV